jgi:hypothetical protein
VPIRSFGIWQPDGNQTALFRPRLASGVLGAQSAKSRWLVPPRREDRSVGFWGCNLGAYRSSRRPEKQKVLPGSLTLSPRRRASTLTRNDSWRRLDRHRVPGIPVPPVPLLDKAPRLGGLRRGAGLPPWGTRAGSAEWARGVAHCAAGLSSTIEPE